MRPSDYTEVKNIPIDTDGFDTITDAMARVLLPEGTAPSAHIPGIDIAGKTGSAQIVSLAMRAKHANDEDFKQNGWFVGFTPRRNPEIIVCVLFEGGEHGNWRRVWRRRSSRHTSTSKTASPPSQQAAAKVDVGAVWTAPDEDGEANIGRRGHFVVEASKKNPPLAAAAPGLQ